MTARVWVLAFALLFAVSLAFAADPAPTPAPTPTPLPTALPAPPQVPARLLPPGAFFPDTGPSDVVFPPQDATLRFNHKLHMTGQALRCTTCHKNATTSTSADDSLIPAGTICDDCHGTNHDDLAKVTASDAPEAQCAFCHIGYGAAGAAGSPRTVVRPFRVPNPNLVFNHKAHGDRNIGCAKCHGAVEELGIATRDQLPRMRGCYGCHQMPDSAARGQAKSACETCHVRAGIREGGRLRTIFASGKLMPPRWLHNSEHTPDWIERHRGVAANDSQFCGNCHKEEFCTDCHDGRVRPRSIHPNDYISMHPIEARQAAQRCASCHREQSFCLTCHQRVGVTMSGPPGARDSGRFHPPKDIWTSAPRRPGHHAFEAERNLNACVSCHIERDCVVCHGASGVGGGFNPHKAGFAGGCATQMRRNPRPCFVCHNPGDGVLAQCR